MRSRQEVLHELAKEESKGAESLLHHLQWSSDEG